MIRANKITMYFTVENQVCVTGNMAREIYEKIIDSNPDMVAKPDGDVFEVDTRSDDNRFNVSFWGDAAKKSANILKSMVLKAYEAVREDRLAKDTIEPNEIRIIVDERGIYSVAVGDKVSKKINIVAYDDRNEKGEEVEDADGDVVYRKVWYPVQSDEE